MSKDPALDALKHLFGGDKKKGEQQQEAQIAPNPQPTDVNQAAPAPTTEPSQPSYQEPTPSFSTPEPSQTPGYQEPAQAAPQPTESPTVVVPEPTVVAPAPEPAVAAPTPSTGGDVEQINGHAVGFAFLRYYREHPEIGQPVDEQHGDVGGWQMFENAILHWDGSNVQVEWRNGHGPQQQTMEAATQSQPRTYTVNSGDNLWNIAQQVYGDGNQWQRIYNANRDKISNPDLIHPGQQLTIP
jgi:nucleoid-associated protein YgaU